MVFIVNKPLVVTVTISDFFYFGVNWGKSKIKIRLPFIKHMQLLLYVYKQKRF